MIDLNHRPTITDQLNNLVDTMYQPQDKERDYLGASILGAECSRAIQYEFAGAAKDLPITARTQRIFDRGHWGESYIAGILKASGVDLWTEKANGQQFGFSDLEGRFKGHIDGAIISCPSGFSLQPTQDAPALWENKTVGVKSFKEMQKAKLKTSRPSYYVQVQVYQGYLGFTETPALFTALNADTMEIHAEIIPFDAEAAQSAIDKAAMIIQATDSGELLPRIVEDPDFFVCKMCSFRRRCHAIS